MLTIQSPLANATLCSPRLRDVFERLRLGRTCRAKARASSPGLVMRSGSSVRALPARDDRSSTGKPGM